MLKVQKVNKYFNRHRKNQIHVINNANIDFGDKGLVAILGNSGSGKTTLLNAVGGLDKVSKGKIYVNGKKITRARSAKIDKIRNTNIGYIFQNYNLINHLTVFENVALVLKMNGIKNKEEIKNRVNYILEILGIYKYRNRMANMLSGGERQRVGIARAIVKNPNIIIADEPTGNLDSKNSLEIMNIIKSISKDKLVILVTHEKDLARFYASRIIEIVDGKIVSDKENQHDDELDYKLEGKIYLKDLETHEEVKSENYNIDFYSDKKEPVNIKIVLKNGNVYVETDKQAEVVEESSSMELINDHYKKISKEEADKYKFDYEKIINKKYKMRYTSIYNPITLVIDGFKRVFNYSILKKLLLIGFLISSMFIVYAISNIFGVLNITDDKFIRKNANYLDVTTGKLNVQEYLEYEKLGHIDYIIPGNSMVNFTTKYNDYYQGKNAMDSISASLAGINMVKDTDLIYGKMPTNSYEVVVDRSVLDKVLNNQYGQNAKQLGIKNVEEYIGRELSCGEMYAQSNAVPTLKNLTIVGIVDLKSPSIYIEPSMFINILTNISKSGGGDYGFSMMGSTYMTMDTGKPEEQLGKKIIDVELVKDKITLTKGRMPVNDYEIIVNASNSYEMKLNKTISEKVNEQKLKVVGYYTSKYDLNEYYSNQNTVKYKYITENNVMSIYSKDKYETMDYFNKKDMNIEDSYVKAKTEYTKSIKENILSSLVLAGIILAISLIEIFLMMRSSFLSRVKEVGILRAIGVKKMDIYKMFIGEILAISLITGTLGITFMSYIIKGLTAISYYKNQFMINWEIIGISALIFLGFNIIVGLLPVYGTIRKTPAKILSGNNVD